MNDLKKRITDILSFIDNTDYDDIVVEYSKLNEFDKSIFATITKYVEICINTTISCKNSNDFIINNTYNEMIKVIVSRVNKLKKINNL